MDDQKERIGVFPSWNWLYCLVVVYTLFLTLLLYVLTLLLDYGVQ